jgi:hypothetical protein
MAVQKFEETVAFPVAKGSWVTVTFEIEVDTLALANQIGPEAWRAKTKRSRALNGAVAIRVIHDNRPKEALDNK